ncbi:MAG: hypothetical protein K2M07_06155 [Muribaculaceae bacterium]|nr:hypothetical protein [Muribaculaceae bacterium]
MTEEAENKADTHWYAIRTRREFRAVEQFNPLCEEVFLPTETIITEGRRRRERAVIPHVLFVKSSMSRILELEQKSKEHPEQTVPFWVYRYPNDRRIQQIPQSSIDLLRLLTAPDCSRCEIFRKDDFRVDQRVRVIGGRFEGYEGYVQRVRKNRHVVVKIEGICMVMLPFIHPDLLQQIE